jgi:hypothetical protein
VPPVRRLVRKSLLFITAVRRFTDRASSHLNFCLYWFFALFFADLNVHEEFWDTLTASDEANCSIRELLPLEPSETSQLVMKKLGKRRGKAEEREQTAQISKTVHILSRGNPLMAAEIVNKLYLKDVPHDDDDDSDDDEGRIENLGYIGELLMNRLDSLNASVLTHLNLGALLGHSFHLEDVVAIMGRYNNVREEEWNSHHSLCEGCLQEAVDNGILFLSSTQSCLYSFLDDGAGGRPFDLDEVVDERMSKFGIPEEEREINLALVASVLDQRVERGILRKLHFDRTTYTFSHEFWRKSISWRTLDSWKKEMMTIKKELDAIRRAAREHLV